MFWEIKLLRVGCIVFRGNVFVQIVIFKEAKLRKVQYFAFQENWVVCREVGSTPWHLRQINNKF